MTQPLERPNLHYHAILTGEPDAWLARYCKARAGEKGIVFCRTRAETERIAAMLTEDGIPAACYHAGLPGEQRERVQDWFAGGELPVLAATSAFGMGVDIPDIRYVVHAGLCGSVQDYVQQAGRAGRDGRPSACVQLITPAELDWYRRYLRGSRDAEADRAVTALLRILLEEDCISRGLIRCFGQKSRPCGTCSACLRRKKGDTGPLASTPRLSGMTPRDLREWCLRTSRDRLARERGIRPSRLLTEGQLIAAAERGQLPEDSLDSEALARFCAAVRF